MSRAIVHKPKLILPRGVKRPTPIPFIETLPDGRTRGVAIDRGQDVYDVAARFIDRGGRYLMRGAQGGMVNLVAVMPDPAGELDAVAFEETEDGPPLLDAIDKLIIASVANMAVVN